MSVAAITKAEGLRAYARHCGVAPSEFVLALTQGEAYELLDHLATGALGVPRNMEALLSDINDAKVSGDPFTFLGHWEICGFAIVRTLDLN